MEFDPRLNKPDYEIKRAYEQALDVINRVKNAEKEYMRNMDNSKWVTNLELRKRPEHYALFLKRLSLESRSLFLFLSTQLPYRALAEAIELDKNRLQKYRQKKYVNNPTELIARLAVYYRTTPQLLENEEVDDSLENHQFYNSGYPKINGVIELISVIENDSRNDYWVRGQVLKIGMYEPLFLRIEYQKGNYLFEFANEKGNLAAFQEILIALKERYECYLGFLNNVFPSKKNVAIVCKRNESTFVFHSNFIKLA
ncbi:hypothetical protein FHS18_000198 [Paenibacillus phyllosphaerae]|uniref:Uncharacterized protein n=1 Tax=Paenibacillus phyllosphaerae TaxID=274593 RepID=A0A7W5ASV6_9BACL|nr:hypothetical protein [Paenibacillus phyllosphaerae]MBB3108170.1 hypothetical protein [Paenibacillus phyllosphaerae]